MIVTNLQYVDKISVHISIL